MFLMAKIVQTGILHFSPTSGTPVIPAVCTATMRSFATQLESQTFNLTEVISENKHQTWQDTLQNTEKNFCYKL